MKTVSGLMLGSAAGLLAMSGAQAADLPVKAKAVEYVKICSLYGAGFYYIPGTDTCIKLGGYLRVETAFFGASPGAGSYNAFAGAQNRITNFYTSRSREDLNIDTRTATEYGVVRTYWAATFSWTTTNSNVAGTDTFGFAGIAGSDTIGVYYTYIQFAGFTLGKTISQFDAPWSNYPGNNFDGLVGGSGNVTGVNQLTYTAQFGNGVSATISAQDQVANYATNLWNTTGNTAAQIVGGAYGTNNFGGAWAPDLVGMVRVDQAWGMFQLSLAAHDNHVAYYGATEPTGHPNDRWGFAVQGALSIKNIPTGARDTINMQAVYTDGASRYNFQGLLGTTFARYSGTGLVGAYQGLGIAGIADGVYSGTSPLNGTQIESVKTWGFRGGFNHNWDPHWNSSFYAAYAQLQYSGNAKAQICANVTPKLVAGSTCNPDFNVAQIGVVTRWVPFKYLAFSADFTYSYLDQKHTGAINSPGNATFFKPAAVYELKDQSAYNLLIRATRFW